VFGWPPVSVQVADAPSARSLSWMLHSFSSFLILAGRSRNQFTGAGRARNRVTSRSRRSTKRGCLARCLAHTTDASSNRISARFVRSWQSPLSNFSLDRLCNRASGYLLPPRNRPFATGLHVGWRPVAPFFTFTLIALDPCDRHVRVGELKLIAAVRMWIAAGSSNPAKIIS
jgi:hypothetical protein